MSISQPSWPPYQYQPTRDCSPGVCSIYCPEWCYFLFPPPPPFDPAGDPDTGPALSPLVIALIALAATAFLLIGYYTIIYRYCRRWHHHPTTNAPSGTGSEEAAASTTGAWQGSPSAGLDQTLINKITVCRYRRGDSAVGGTNCSVCLSEFREEESLRLLPKCSHAFHVNCIDTWLKSHPNCPLCRAGIVWVTPPPPTSTTSLAEVELAHHSGSSLAATEENAPKEEERSTVIDVSDGVTPSTSSGQGSRRSATPTASVLPL